MSKLDERGLVPYHGYNNVEYGKPISWFIATTEERDAMLELFEDWIEAADEVIKKNHYRDNGQEGIAYLYGKLGELRGKSGPDK